MRRSVTAAWIAVFVVLNVSAFLYLRHWLSEPPPDDVATATPVPSPKGDPRIEGVLSLSGRPDGSVLRVTNGVCREPDPESELESEPATAWVAPPGAGPSEVELDSLVETLGVGRTATGWWVVGTDESCQVAAWTSSDAGRTWQAGPVPASAWYLQPGDPNVVRSPKGPVQLADGCEAASVQPGPLRVYVVCTDGRLLAGDRTARELTAAPEIGVRAVAVGSAGTLARLSVEPPCNAQLDVAQGRKTLVDECLGSGRAANGVTWIGDDLALQIGYDMLDYDTATNEWQTRN